MRHKVIKEITEKSL